MPGSTVLCSDDERARLRKVLVQLDMKSCRNRGSARKDCCGKTSPKRHDDVHLDPRKPLDVLAGGFADRPQTQAKRLLETRKKATLLFNSADIYCYNPMSGKVELTPLKSGRGVIRGFIQHGRGWQERLRFSPN